MKTLLPSSDLKNLLLPILALLAVIHALVPFLIVTLGSAEYFQLQTLKLATSNEKLAMAYAEKELQLFTNLSKHKQVFALKIATLDVETELKSMDLLFRHEFRNLTIFAPIVELKAVSTHVLEIAKVEQETKRISAKDLARFRTRSSGDTQVLPD